jgi:tetratricopeptide (TPR) repeat protein
MYEKELETCQRFRELFPNRVAAQGTACASALAALGRVDELDQVINECMVLTESNAQAEVMRVFRIAVGELRKHGHGEDANRLANRAVEYCENVRAGEGADHDRLKRLASSLYLARRWDESQEVYDRLSRMDPGNQYLTWRLGTLAARRGNRDYALEVLDEVCSDDRPYAYGVSAMRCAAIAALLGERERAVSMLRRAFAEGTWHSSTHFDPDFEPLWGYPHYEELVRPKG